MFPIGMYIYALGNFARSLLFIAETKQRIASKNDKQDQEHDQQ